MRQPHSDAHFRHALFALQDADGYVEALFSMARENSRRAALPRPASAERRETSGRRPSRVH